MNYIFFLFNEGSNFSFEFRLPYFKQRCIPRSLRESLLFDSNFLVFTFRAFVVVYTHIVVFLSNSWWKMYLKELLVALDSYAVKFIKLLRCYLRWFSAPCNILTVWCDILWLSIFLFCIPRQGNHMFPSACCNTLNVVISWNVSITCPAKARDQNVWKSWTLTR